MRILQCGPSQVRKLAKPFPRSRKGDNGVLVIIGGSREYHGAPLHAINTACKFVDLVYYHSPFGLNMRAAKELRQDPDFIIADGKQLQRACEKADAILIGPGLGLKRKRLVDSICRNYSGKKIVLDADALKLVDKKLLGANVMVTPHAAEFKALFGVDATPSAAAARAKEHGCTILLKDRGKSGFDWITDGKALFKNGGGNAFMAKGGTGDVLAGLAAAFACKNSLPQSACAAAYVNSLAGSMLLATTRGAFSSSDLAREVPLAYARVLR